MLDVEKTRRRRLQSTSSPDPPRRTEEHVVNPGFEAIPAGAYTATIALRLMTSDANEIVYIKSYDVMGNLVKTLLSRFQADGSLPSPSTERLK